LLAPTLDFTVHVPVYRIGGLFARAVQPTVLPEFRGGPHALQLNAQFFGMVSIEQGVTAWVGLVISFERAKKTKKQKKNAKNLPTTGSRNDKSTVK